MAGEEKKEEDKKEEKVVLSAEEFNKLKVQLEEQSKKLKEHEEQMKANSEQYQKNLEQVNSEGASLKGYQPLSSGTRTAMSADDFMVKILEDAQKFEEVYQMPKRYKFSDPYESMILRMRIDLEQGLPWDHVKKLYAAEMKKYNIE